MQRVHDVLPEAAGEHAASRHEREQAIDDVAELEVDAAVVDQHDKRAIGDGEREGKRRERLHPRDPRDRVVAAHAAHLAVELDEAVLGHAGLSWCCWSTRT